VADSDAPSEDERPEHQNDGLDLARSIARDYTNRPGPDGAAPGVPRKRQPRRGRGGQRSGGTQVSGAHPDDRDPQTLEAAMSRLVAQHGWKTDVAMHGLFGRWDLIVGAEVAQHCKPHHFADGELFVQADSTAWATQMGLLAPRIVAKMNEELGDGTVLRIKTIGPQAPSWKKGRLSARGRGPRDTYG